MAPAPFGGCVTCFIVVLRELAKGPAAVVSSEGMQLALGIRVQTKTQECPLSGQSGVEPGAPGACIFPHSCILVKEAPDGSKASHAHLSRVYHSGT